MNVDYIIKDSVLIVKTELDNIPSPEVTKELERTSREYMKNTLNYDLFFISSTVLKKRESYIIIQNYTIVVG